MYFYFLFIPLLMLMFNVFFIPLDRTGSFVFMLSTTWPTLLILKSLKNNTDFESVKMNKKIGVVSNLFLYLFIYLSFLLSYIIWFYILGYWLSLFTGTWIGMFGDSIHYNEQYGKLYLDNLIVITIYYTLLNYSFYLILDKYITNTRVASLIIFALILASFIFGGLVNQSLFGGSYVSVDEFPFDDTYYYSYMHKVYYLDSTFSYILNFISFIVFPWNSINQLNNVAFLTPLVGLTENTNIVIDGVNYTENIILLNHFNIFELPFNGINDKDAIMMSLFMIVPIVHTIIYSLLYSFA